MGKTPNKCIAMVKQNPLMVFTVLGVLCGLAIGFAIRPLYPSDELMMWIGLPGQLYLRALKMMIVPMIISTVISGTASLDPRSNGKISFVAFIYFFLTNLLGALVGIAAFWLSNPGEGGSYDGTIDTKLTEPLQTHDIFADLLRNIITDNMFEATFAQTQTTYLKIDSSHPRPVNHTNTSVIIEKTLGKGGGANILGILFASVCVGMAVSALGEKGKPVYSFFESASKVVILIMRWFMRMTPIGVCSLILVPVAGIKDVGVQFGQLGVFTAAVVVSVLVHQLLVLPVILFALTRRNPYYHLSVLPKPWIIAFAAAVTVVTIPEQLEICEKRLGVDPRVARFTIPLGVTLSGNGPAIFIVCACLFISNLTGSPPSTAAMLVVGLLASVTTLAAPAVPSSSIVTVLLILTSLGIPTEPIALLLAVEFFLDRLRTTTEVINNSMCAVVTQHFCRGDLTMVHVDRTDDHTEDIEDQTATERRRQPEKLCMLSKHFEKETKSSRS